MLGVYIAAAMIVLVLVGTIYGFYENKYLVDFLDDADAGLSKLRRLGIEKLELKRYVRTMFLGGGFSASRNKRQQIPLESYDHNKSSTLASLATVSDYLEVTGYKKKIPHTLFDCTYSPENKDKLLAFIENYNSEGLQ